MRLDKFLAEAGGCTRSEAKLLIKSGKVTVNGKIVKKADEKIDEKADAVFMKNEEIKYHKYEYYMLNKPAGVVSATSDEKDKTVISLIGSNRKDLFPVGRLDKDTEGLLLITNDGVLAHNLLSPKKHVNKKYYAKISGYVTKDTVSVFAEGLKISNEFTAMPAKLEIITSDEVSEIYVTIQEGKYHQIKKMFIAVGMEVIYLKRISMKNLVLDKNLAPGMYRELKEDEINDLFKA